MNDWENADKYDEITQQYVSKETIWNESQNYPDLIVDDILSLIDDYYYITTEREELRNRLYAILLKRGVNKWLMVRKLLIRLKKIYQYKVKELQRELEKAKQKNTNHCDIALLKKEMTCYSDIRRDLSTLCSSPRWVIWNGKCYGLVDTIGLKQGDERKFIKLHDMLIKTKFEK